LPRTVLIAAITDRAKRRLRGLGHKSASGLGVPLHRLIGRLRPFFLALPRDEGGVIAVLSALALTLVIGVIGLAVDVGMWYRSNRAMQNAADAAVIAAALNGSSSYDSEAKAVAARYGFVDGANGITVTALNNQTCPDGTTGCYQVRVAQASAPRFFSPAVGNFNPALAGTAMAGGSQTHSYCLLALASSGNDLGIDARGVASADLTGCSIMSNTGANCSGHDLKATYGDAHKTNDGCGITQNSNVPLVADPYSSLASNIPPVAPACSGSSYPQEPSKKNDPVPPGLVQWSDTPTGPGVTKPPSPLPNPYTVCGDLVLMGDTTLTTIFPGSVLVIRNGRLDTNGHTFRTAAGSALTIIFSGPDLSGTYTHAPTGSGTLDFQAPTSGTWKGIAIYQDPALTKGVDISEAGNTPTWNLTGVVYLPHSSVTFKGIVNKSSNGASCFLLVVDNITIKGTGKILANGACAAAGVTLPTNNVGAVAMVK
jgi:Flp pilus assembly protein TadG